MVVFVPLYLVPTKTCPFGFHRKGKFYSRPFDLNRDGVEIHLIDLFLPEHFCSTYSYGVEYASGGCKIPSEGELAAREKELHNRRAFISYSYCE
jgi:hypothetical protein